MRIGQIVTWLAAIEQTDREIFTNFTWCDFSEASQHLLDFALEGQVDLAEGEVRENPLGGCLQVEGYDLARLMTDVRFIDNDLNLDATSLPVPDPAPPAAVGR